MDENDDSIFINCFQNYQRIKRGISSLNRDILFIGHANPADNTFALWLSLRLINEGYKVWCDELNLRGGSYNWDIIDNVIRNDAVKYLLVVSKDTFERQGVIDEFEFARSIARQNKLDKFIVPLKIDNVPFNARIGQNRINHIDLSKSWAEGLNKLLKDLMDEKINKDINGSNPSFVNSWWKINFIRDKKVIRKEMLYRSSWFPILELPDYLNFHEFGMYFNSGASPKDFSYPAIPYSKYLITFCDFTDFNEEIKNLDSYNPNNTLQFKTKDIFDGTFQGSERIKKDIKRILVMLFKRILEIKFIDKKFDSYELANKNIAYWLKDNIIENNRIGRIKLVGSMKEKFWHYAVSINPKFYPCLSLSIKSHLVFTFDGINLIESTNSQHRLRRKKGRNWWNRQWSNRLFALMEYLSEENENIVVSASSRENCVISKSPILFYSHDDYEDPNMSEKEDLEVEVDETYNDFDEDYEENDFEN